MLRDLSVLYSELQMKSKKFLKESGIEIILSDAFREKYGAIFQEKPDEDIEFGKYTSKLHSKRGNIVIPHQWFYLAFLALPYYKEFVKYRGIITDYFSATTELKKFCENAKDNKNFDEITFSSIISKSSLSDEDEELLRKFVTDYTWWHGGRFIDRNDSYGSVILSLLNLINVSSDHVATIVKILSENEFEMDNYQKYFNLTKVSETEMPNTKLNYKTGYKSYYPLNRILFGAPGTGKSHTLDEEMTKLLIDVKEDYERVTFHPDYAFSQFVGTYKPVPVINEEGKEEISYQYVPGPFIRIYVEALKSAQTDNPKPYLLLIEEINRAKVSAVFGDLFQLLDRKDGVSEYPIRTSEDLKQYLAKELNVSEDQVATLILPDNLYIWATMNSADQGVFPMDTAFKRRWDFEYLELDGGEAKIEGYKFNVAGQTYEWNALRKAFNEVLSEDYNVNEDKLMGPFFIKLDSYKIEIKSEASNPAESDKKSYEPILNDKFLDVFKNKVLMYLFDDAAKQKRKDFFQGVENSNRYSVICKEFDVKGLQIFAHSVSKKYDEFASSDKD